MDSLFQPRSLINLLGPGIVLCFVTGHLFQPLILKHREYAPGKYTFGGGLQRNILRPMSCDGASPTDSRHARHAGLCRPAAFSQGSPSAFSWVYKAFRLQNPGHRRLLQGLIASCVASAFPPVLSSFQKSLSNRPLVLPPGFPFRSTLHLYHLLFSLFALGKLCLDDISYFQKPFIICSSWKASQAVPIIHSLAAKYKHNR